MIAKSVKSADFADFDADFADYDVDFAVFADFTDFEIQNPHRNPQNPHFSLNERPLA